MKEYLETPKPGDPCFKKVSLTIIADHTTAAQKAVSAGKKMGLSTHLWPLLLQGEAKDAARTFLQGARTKGLWVAAGETTVNVRGKGFGGRNQEFVLAALRHLQSNQTLLSIGTDGVDGFCPKKTAGAIADQTTLTGARTKGLKIVDFLKRNDSYTFFNKTGGLIKTGVTGTNLGDLMLLISSTPPDCNP